MWDSSGCMICGRGNQDGLQLEFVPEGEDGAVARGRIKDLFEGFAGLAHGGAIAAILDDAMWWAVLYAQGARTLTAELTVRFQQPVPVGQLFVVRARVVQHRRRLSRAEAVLTDEDGSVVLARAEGAFLVPPE